MEAYLIGYSINASCFTFVLISGELSKINITIYLMTITIKYLMFFLNLEVPRAPTIPKILIATP